MELVDVADSKSAGGDTVWVRVPPPAPKKDADPNPPPVSPSATNPAKRIVAESEEIPTIAQFSAKPETERWWEFLNCQEWTRRSEIHSTPFQGGPFWGRLKTAFRSFAPSFQLEPAALGFELVLGA